MIKKQVKHPRKEENDHDSIGAVGNTCTCRCNCSSALFLPAGYTKYIAVESSFSNYLKLVKKLGQQFQEPEKRQNPKVMEMEELVKKCLEWVKKHAQL